MASCVPLHLQLEWYKIRDTFFGENNVAQDIPLALLLAALCDHADARWLTEACAGKDVKTEEDAKRVFSAFGQNDARALCFAWLCGAREGRDSYDLLRRSATLGCAFAQAKLAGLVHADDEDAKFFAAQVAATQGERDGFYRLGFCFERGRGCEIDFEKARENYLLSMQLGRHRQQVLERLGCCYDESDVRRWQCWGEAASGCDFPCFIVKFVEQVELFHCGFCSDAVMYAIGQALHGNVNESQGTIFNSYYMFEKVVDSAKQAVAFFEKSRACRKAVDCWTLVGFRFHVVKDIRKLIANLIWDTRREKLWSQVK